MKFTSFFLKKKKEKKKKEKKKKKKEARSLTRKEKTVIIFHLIECFRKIVNFQERFFFSQVKKNRICQKLFTSPKYIHQRQKIILSSW